MLSQLLIGGLPARRPGLNALVPAPWFQKFLQANISTSSVQQISVPPLTMNSHINDDCFDNLALTIRNIEEKCNHLSINKFTFNPQVKAGIQWKPINLQLWRIVLNKHPNAKTVYTYIQQGVHFNPHGTMLIEVVFCSRQSSQAFIGFLSAQAPLVPLIRDVGFQLGYVQVQGTKITLLNRISQQTYSPHQLQKYSLKNAPDRTLMTFNLQSRHEEQWQQLDFWLPQDNLHISGTHSNQAVMGDLNTMQDDSTHRLFDQPNNDRTISTGAQTPFSFALSQGFDLDRQYRVNELFGAKQPEQIEQMRKIAESRMEKELIKVPVVSEEEYRTGLDKLAQQLLESAFKKRSYKEKELQFE